MYGLLGSGDIWLRYNYMKIWNLKVQKNRSGYYGNLGSLRAGTRHHGDFSVMGTPSLQPFLKSYWLTPVQMTGQLSQSMQIWRARDSINAMPATITSESDTEHRRLGSSEHGDYRDVSFPLSGNRGYHSNRSVPFRAVTRHHGDFSVMGMIFNPAVREATKPIPYTH